MLTNDRTNCLVGGDNMMIPSQDSKLTTTHFKSKSLFSFVVI